MRAFLEYCLVNHPYPDGVPLWIQAIFVFTPIVVLVAWAGAQNMADTFHGDL